jgi:uncharacterized membrane protein
VRGAAVVGALVLGIAALLFFQYSIEHGLITPRMRLALGIVTGLVCMTGAPSLHKRGYELTANAITGAGAVVLYASSWAAHAVLHLWPFGGAFAAMVLVTIACCVLAHRYSSQLIAVLGLVGGFSTPLALSSGRDNPVGLFGYLLLINLGFLFVANKRRWPAIGLIGLLGTFVIEALWIFAQMRPDTFALGLVIVGVFALLFAVVNGRQPASERARWRISQVGALLLPFVFAIYFAQHVDIGTASIGWHLYPMALLCALLCAAASWMARMQNASIVAAGAAAGTAAVVLVWTLANDLETARTWELVLCAAGLAAVLHGFCEWRPKAGDHRAEIADGHAVAGAALAIGLFAALILAAGRTENVGAWPWIAGFIALSGVSARLAAISGRESLHVVAGVATAVGTCAWLAANDALPGGLESSEVWVLFLGLALFFQGVALVRRAAGGRRLAWWSALIVAAIFAAAYVGSAGIEDASPAVALGGLLSFGVAIALAATGARSGIGLAIAVVLTPAAQSVWIVEHAASSVSSMPSQIAWVAAGAALFTYWPFLRRSAWSASHGVWRAAACACPLAFWPLRTLVERIYTREYIGALPMALCVLVGAGPLVLGRTSRPDVGDPARGAAAHVRTGQVWYAAVALGFFAWVLPMQIDRDVVQVGAALYALALTWLWTRFDHEPLRFIAIALFAGSTAALVGARFAGSFARYESVLFNGLLYTFLLPAAAAITAAVWMRPFEMDRVPSSSTGIGKLVPAPGAVVAGSCGLLLVFAWINLVIINAFEREPRFDWSFEHMPARDMVISIAWAVYALSLLLLGVAKRLGGLRWGSLALLVLTIGKVFMFDLGTLGGLYRVASLFGLAVSLLLVSLLYQRFVNVPKPE